MFPVVYDLPPLASEAIRVQQITVRNRAFLRSLVMALHNYIYLKHKTSDQECHRLISREHDNRPNVEYIRNKYRGGTKKSDNEGGGPSGSVDAAATNVSSSIMTTSTPDRTE